MKIKVALIAILTVILIQACKDSSSGPEPGPDPEPPVELQVTSVEPESGTYGTAVTISGKGFNENSSSNEITFNGVDAVVDSASSTVLKTTVPEGATAGKVTVSVGSQTAEGPEFEVLTTGAVEVIVTTSGPDQDRDGYIINIDLQKTLGSSTNDTLLFVDVEQGSRQLGLEDLDNECSVPGANPREISVVAQDTIQAMIEIQCEEVVLKNKIVYERGSALYIMNADGTGVKKISDSKMDQSPAISPDGKLIATAGQDMDSGEENPNNEIFTIDASGYPITQITQTTLPIDNSYPSWSPDGDKILLTQRGNQETLRHDIVVIDTDGTGKINLTNNDSNDMRASWSPDGSKILFSSDRDGVRKSIFVVNSDGTNTVKLTDNSNFDDFPQWSPDGSQIVYLCILEGIEGNEEICVMEADGSNIIRLTNDNYEDSFPSWSSDGSKIVFSRRIDNQRDIFKMNTDGTGVINLTNTPDVHESNPDWSPVK